MAGFDIDELHAYLRKVAPPQCPSCKANDWIVAERPIPALIPTVEGHGEPWSGAGIPALPMTCGTCGFIRLHSTQVLQAIADADKKGTNGGP